MKLDIFLYKALNYHKVYEWSEYLLHLCYIYKTINYKWSPYLLCSLDFFSIIILRVVILTVNIKNQTVRYCVNCGAKFADYCKNIPNYCPNCGVAVRDAHKERKVCSICHDHIHSAQLVQCPYCGHSFHYKCLNQWLKGANACPFCMNAYLTPKSH